MQGRDSETGNRGVKMVRKIGAAMLCAGALAAASAEDGGIQYKRLSVAGFMEAGKFWNPRYGAKPPVENDWTDHFGTFITQSADVNERLAFDIGLGGIFQYMKSEEVNSRWLGTQWKMFFIGPTVADLRYGSAKDGDGFGFQFGRFTYKYNPEATNLGEYLFRSAAYPTFLMGGGYAFLGDPMAFLQGSRLHWSAGALKADVLLTTETTMPALYDFSLAGLVSWSVGDGLLDLGAGVNFKRLLAVRPSKTAPEVSTNSYFTRGGRTYVGYVTYYTEQANFHKAQAARFPADSAVHNARAAYYSAIADSVGNTTDSLDASGNPKTRGWIDPATGLAPGAEFYSQKAILAMLRASLDLKKAIGSDAFGPNDLRMSLEVNVLGLQNKPVFYEKVTDRMPITLSVNLPAFKVLDLVSLQLEYFNSPWMNGYANLLGNNNKNLPLPSIPTGGDSLWNRSAFNDVSKRDNFSWSLLLKKNFAGAAWASLQMARDHSRMVSKDFWTGGGLEPTEVLNEETTWGKLWFDENWYLVAQVGFGI